MVIPDGATPTGPGFFFDARALRQLAATHRDAYADAWPHPHVVVDGFLGEAMARGLAARFPGPLHPRWKKRDYPQQSRLGQLPRSGFDGVDGAIRHLLAELSGMAFLDFLGGLTGVRGLLADPHFTAAGPMLTLPGGHLALHADFNRDRTRNLSREVTALYYLNPDWQPDWGGALELWDAPRTSCQRSYLPVLDRLVIMKHGDSNWHGHPVPLACPEGRFRAVIAAYYYTAESHGDVDAHGAIWADEQGD